MFRVQTPKEFWIQYMERKQRNQIDANQVLPRVRRELGTVWFACLPKTQARSNLFSNRNGTIRNWCIWFRVDQPMFFMHMQPKDYCIYRIDCKTPIHQNTANFEIINIMDAEADISPLSASVMGYFINKKCTALVAFEPFNQYIKSIQVVGHGICFDTPRWFIPDICKKYYDHTSLLWRRYEEARKLFCRGEIDKNNTMDAIDFFKSHISSDRFYHISSEQIHEIRTLPVKSQWTSLKPRGLWLSRGDTWLDFVGDMRDDDDDDDEMKQTWYMYQIDFQSDGIYTFRNLYDIEKFLKMHKISTKDMSIGWETIIQKLSKQGYKGFAWDPYEKCLGAYPQFAWFNTIDVPSVVLWDSSAIENVQLVGGQTTHLWHRVSPASATKRRPRTSSSRKES